MLSLPSQFTNGFAAHSSSIYFVDVTVQDSGVTKHLYISNVLTGSVTWTYSGSVVNVQSSYLASLIVDAYGSEVEVDGIGEMDFSIEVENGGGQSTTNETQLILLNQGDFVSENAYDFDNPREGELVTDGWNFAQSG